MTSSPSALRSSPLAATLVGLATFTLSGNSHACPDTPYTSAICAMAVGGGEILKKGFGDGVYLPADGRELNVSDSTNQALFSLIGTSYGGDGKIKFKIPDLQGRTIIGAGTYTAHGNNINYAVGATGGLTQVMLTTAQVPLLAHSHTLSGATVTTGVGSLVGTVNMGGVTATTSLAGVTATTSLANVTAATTLPAATVDGSAFTLYASSGGTLTNTPFNASLATPTLPTRIYSSATPYVAMASGSLGSIRGTAPVTYGGPATTNLTGTPTTTLSGTSTTTLSGTAAVTFTGSPTVVIGGGTGSTSLAPTKPVPTMSPYLVLPYFIAVKGIYPPSN